MWVDCVLWHDKESCRSCIAHVCLWLSHSIWMLVSHSGRQPTEGDPVLMVASIHASVCFLQQCVIANFQRQAWMKIYKYDNKTASRLQQVPILIHYLLYHSNQVICSKRLIQLETEWVWMDCWITGFVQKQILSRNETPCCSALFYTIILQRWWHTQ